MEARVWGEAPEKMALAEGQMTSNAEEVRAMRQELALVKQSNAKMQVALRDLQEGSARVAMR